MSLRKCAWAECDVEFEPASWNQKYHSGDCKRKAENERNRRQYMEDVAEVLAKTVGPAYLEDEDLDAEDQLTFLRKELVRVARLAEKHKTVKNEVVDSVYQAAFDAFSQLSLPTIPQPANDKRKGDEEVAVAVCADWQLGKLTPTYNSDICRERISAYADKVIETAKIFRAHHPVRHLRIWFLGDIVEGEEIFQGQAHLIDSSLYRQVGVNGPEIIRDMILKFLTEFDTVHIVGVMGNHGAIGGNRRRDYNGETNMDRLLYKIVEHIFANEPRVTFDIPDGHGERNFYAVDAIGEYRTLLIHGDQLPPPSSAHTYYKKVMGWKDGAIPESFEDVFMGHYHQNCKMTLGNSILRVSPSPESYNTYAQETLAVMGRPAQHLLFVHPQIGVTSEHTIYLD